VEIRNLFENLLRPNVPEVHINKRRAERRQEGVRTQSAGSGEQRVESRKQKAERRKKSIEGRGGTREHQSITFRSPDRATHASDREHENAGPVPVMRRL
jgi:hypothetical protein